MKGWKMPLNSTLETQTQMRLCGLRDFDQEYHPWLLAEESRTIKGDQSLLICTGFKL
jgi:hypothetical protein